MSENQLLAQLPPRERAALAGVAQRVERPQGRQLYVQGRPMTEVHFPVAGVFSVILHMQDGDQVEALTVGREGVVGTAAFLSDDAPSPFETVAQIGGATLTLPLAEFQRLAHELPEVDALVRRYIVFEQRHVHQSAACNALHLAEQRLSRWLLMSRDRSDEDRLPLTQEFLAAMLGVRRQSVGQVALDLQRRGLIDYRRGVVVIRDREGLEALSCECYATIKRFYDETMRVTAGAAES
jgi:CRP-like cAMP-binding protein